MAGEIINQLQPEVMGAMTGVAKSVIGSGGKYLPFVGGGAAVLGGGFKSFTVVKQEHVGIRTRFGKFMNDRGELHKFVRPGLQLIVPFTHSIEVISTQNVTMELARFAVRSMTGRQHDIESRLTWGVVKEKDDDGNVIDYGTEYPKLVYKALMAARSGEELSQGVAAICTDGLRRIVQRTDAPDQLDSLQAQASLRNNCQEELLQTYGVEIRRLNITSASYSASDMVVNGRAQTDGMPPQLRQSLAELGTAVPGIIPDLHIAQGS